jgi:DNA-binding NtrC family response regulator
MKRIVVIDDDEQMRGFIEEVLTRAGYEVCAAASAREGLDNLKQKTADLIITDLIMPDKEGLETIMELRRLYAGVKIIAISGGGRSAPWVNLKTAAQLGASGTLAKPFSRQQILDEIDRLLAPESDERTTGTEAGSGPANYKQ